MKQLDEKQTFFAEWLATPIMERSPATMEALSTQLSVTRVTLSNWKKRPEIIQLVNQLYTEKLIELVGPATELLRNAVKKPGSISRVSFDCAKYIVSDWGKKYQGDGGVVRSIADLFKKYHPDE